MFIKEIISEPRFVEGRKFVERTIESKFNKGNVSITTTYMDNKPIVKQYIFNAPNKLKHYWKTIRDLTIKPRIDFLA